ncbi:MAG: hypothetical protein NXI30_13015 [bacterium]|nr:hypothetical protein [bacterium]
MQCSDTLLFQAVFPSHEERRTAGRQGRRSSRSPALAFAFAMIVWLLPELAFAQASTHASFDMTQRERVGGVEVAPIVDSNPGQDDGASILVTGQTVGVWGSQNVTVEARVTATADGLPRLSAEGEHVFDLTGVSLASDVWLEGDSNMLARATLSDELTLSGVAGNSATLELYFQIRGMSDALIDIDEFGDLSYTMATQIDLSATMSSPQSGSDQHDTSLVFQGGYLPRDLDEQRFVDDYVVLTLDVDPSEVVPIELTLEIDPNTNLRNFVEIGTLNATGLHRPSLWDMGAELLGVVVRDDVGAIVPTATIVSDEGYEFPVEDEPPAPIPPTSVIVSPVAVVDSSFTEYNATVPFTQMHDQSGLYVNFTSGQTGWDVYFSDPDADRSSGSYTGNWQSELVTTLPATGSIDFDLGSEMTIDTLALWNLTMEDIRVSVATDAAGPWTEVGQYTLPDRFGWFSYDAEILDLGGAHVARYLRIDVDSAHLTGSSSTYVVVGEAAVRAIPVPEPAMVGSLVAGGLALAALRMRHRRVRLAGAAPSASARAR